LEDSLGNTNRLGPFAYWLRITIRFTRSRHWGVCFNNTFNHGVSVIVDVITLIQMDYLHTTERLAKFDAAFGESPEYEFLHQEHGWRYCTQNPWGNWVRGHCEFDGDVHQFCCSLAKQDPEGRDGLYADWRNECPPQLRLWAIVQEERVDRTAYEYWMSRFRDCILERHDELGPMLGGELVRLGPARRKD